MNNVSFYGGETAGSIGKRNLNPQKYNASPEQTPINDCPDIVCFKGKEKNNGSSVLGGLAAVIVLAGLAVGGLGYAHKADLVGKLKDGKFKDFLRKSDKITEPCHNLCRKVKEFCLKYYNKIKDFFSKNK